MQIIPFEELYQTEVVISEAFSKTQNWNSRGDVYSCLQRPKPSHTLLWFKNCYGEIVDASSKRLTVKQNQLIYTPKDAEYIINFFGTAPDQVDTVVIHFQLRDTLGNDIAPSLLPQICIESVDGATALTFDKLADEFRKNVICMPDATSMLYKLWASICKKRRRENTAHKYNCIKEGIELLENDVDISIKEIADVCCVSECYFRRLFKEYSGETPMDFRQRHRIEKAKQLLLSDMFTISEIARELHFADIYHFSKTFKSIVGVSPSKFISSYSDTLA